MYHARWRTPRTNFHADFFRDGGEGVSAVVQTNAERCVIERALQHLSESHRFGPVPTKP